MGGSRYCAGADGQLAAPLPCQSREVLVHGTIVGKDALGMLEHTAALGRELYAAPATREKHQPRLPFEFGDVVGDGRLRDEQLLGGPREVEVPCYADEHLEAKIDYHSIWQ